MLLCPLTLQEHPSGDSRIGVLAVFGEQRILADLSATMDILAHQVALAAEQIMLRREVMRQGNEAYFRTLVQDTSDAVLIVGDDGKIRYATPSATSIFGEISGGRCAPAGPRRRRGARRPRPDPHAAAGRREPQLPLRGPADHPPRRRQRQRPGQVQRSARRPDRGRAGAHLPGRDRAAPARGAAEAPGLPRRADQAAQPAALPGPDLAAARQGQARRHDRRRAVRGPGRLQGRQRHDGPRRRRRAAGGRRGPAVRPDPGLGHGRAARRG